MIITSLEPVGKTRVQVSIDGEKAFVLYRNEAYRMGIREGGSIPEKVYEEIMQEILPKRAKLRCMNILKSADKTEWQLRTRLRQGGYPKKVEDIAIEYVRSFHYIDDVPGKEQTPDCAGTESKRRFHC